MCSVRLAALVAPAQKSKDQKAPKIRTDPAKRLDLYGLIASVSFGALWPYGSWRLFLIALTP